MSLLEAARRAPSAYDVQPWRFIYARRGTSSWRPVHDSLVEFNRLWTKRAAALVVIVLWTADGPGRRGYGRPGAASARLCRRMWPARRAPCGAAALSHFTPVASPR